MHDTDTDTDTDTLIFLCIWVGNVDKQRLKQILKPKLKSNCCYMYTYVFVLKVEAT